MDIRQLVRIALLTALVAAVTRVVQIPMPATEGYINVGDAVIIAGALLFGGRVGGTAGGIGSALADLLGGYSHWVPFTLLIKGIEGWLIGLGATRFAVDLRRPVGLLAGTGIALVGLVWMVGGYFLVERYLYSLGPALASLPGNTLQAAASLVCGMPLAAALQRQFHPKNP
jgi:uncharacterized membrane protein